MGDLRASTRTFESVCSVCASTWATAKPNASTHDMSVRIVFRKDQFTGGISYAVLRTLDRLRLLGTIDPGKFPAFASVNALAFNAIQLQYALV